MNSQGFTSFGTSVDVLLRERKAVQAPEPPELKRAQFAVSLDVVQGPADFAKRRESQQYDVVLASSSVPNWTGMQALELLRELKEDTPFIFLAGDLGDDVMDAFFRKGVHDCVDMNRPACLPPAVALAVDAKAPRDDRNRVVQELRHSEAHDRASVENHTFGICRFDGDGRFLDVNEALVNMLGYGSRDELMAANLATDIIRDPIERARLFEPYRRTGHVDCIELEWKRKDGEPMKVRLSGRRVGTGQGAPDDCEIIAEDITAQRAAEERLRLLAATDALTGLANYRRLTESLESELQRSDRTGRAFALLVFDLDGMKGINDGYGHLAGNRALCRLADIFRFSCRSIDTPARYGGDEFGIVLPETGPQEANKVKLRICESLAKDQEQPRLTVSAGVAGYPQDGKTIEALLHTADCALYKMKRA